MRGSKRLSQAIARGKVVVKNITAGEVNLQLLSDDNDQITIIIGPYAVEEIAPKYVSIKALKKARNLDKNLGQGSRKLQVL